MNRIAAFAIGMHGCVSIASAQGYPTDDPFLKPYQLTASEYYKRCDRDLSNVDRANCFDDQYQALKRQMRAAYKKSLIDAETIGEDIVIGGKTAAERAKLNRAEVVRAQSAWNSYTNAVCGTIAQREERNGANGAGMVVEMMACFIRHSVARLNELTR